MHRYASIFLLLLLCLSALPQPSVRSNPDELRRFHNDALNITYFYPSRFVPVPSPPSTAFSTDTPQCVRPTLFANSVTPIDTSSFALSTIDNTCLDVLRRATQLGSFIREDILGQLKQWRTEDHPRAHPLHHRRPSRRHHLSLGSDAGDLWQSRAYNLRCQGMHVGQHSD